MFTIGSIWQLTDEAYAYLSSIHRFIPGRLVLVVDVHEDADKEKAEYLMHVEEGMCYTVLPSPTSLLITCRYLNELNVGIRLDANDLEPIDYTVYKGGTPYAFDYENNQDSAF